MRDRRHVFDHVDLEARCLERTNRCFTAGTRALDVDFDLLEAMLHRCLGSCFRCHLRSKRRALARAAEAKAASACPGKCVAALVSERHNRIIKRRADMRYAIFHILANFFLRADCFLNCHQLTLLH